MGCASGSSLSAPHPTSFRRQRCPTRPPLRIAPRITACERAVMTHGGMGYSQEFHVERYLREALIPRIAPVTPHMILNFIAEKVLGLPKSY